MKKYLLGAFTLSLIFGGIACSKDDEVAEIFSFTVDGSTKDFANSIVVNDYPGTYGVTLVGEPSSASSNIESITITLPTEGTGTYTEDNYNSMSSTVTRPNIKYQDKNGNVWQYYGSYYGDDLNFTINITTYDSGSGEVAGTFSGKLDGSYSNGSNAPSSILIENGSFSHIGITLAE